MGLFDFLKPNVEKMEQKRDANHLIKALRHKDARIRMDAVDALGRLGDIKAVQPLVRSLKTDSNRYVVEKAALALEKLGVPSDPSVQAWYWVVKKDWRKVLSIGDVALKLLIARLRDKEADMRHFASDSLAKIGAAAVRPLVEAFMKSEGDARKPITDTLLAMGDDATEPLTTLLKGKDYSISHGVATIFGCIGVPPDPTVQAWYWVVRGKLENLDDLGMAAVDALTTNLSHPDSSKRYYIANKLAQLNRDPRAIDILYAGLKNPSSVVRKYAAESLGRAGDVNAIDTLLNALHDDDIYVAAAVARALLSIGGPRVDNMRSDLKYIDMKATRDAIQTLYGR